MGQPHWILTAFFGAIVGYLLPYVVRAVVFVGRRFRRGVVEGEWHTYHTTNRDGEFQVESAVWYVRRGFDNKFVVREEREGVEGPVYKGTLGFERNFWLVRLKGVKHKQEVLIRLFSPVKSWDAVTWGLYLGVDFQGRPMAGPIVVSRNPLSVVDALGFLSDKMKVYSKMRLLIA